jgi:RHH-type proline utilization regulon transcriptional repressor/proline dehydrogenase/delta 1-pyrroline-5-carboxylate dehydrogenase
VVVAGVRAGTAITVSAPVGLPAAVRRALGESEITVHVESDEQWIERMQVADPRPPRARLVGSAAAVATLSLAVSAALEGDPDFAVYDNEVTTAGRLELLPFLREQSVTITAHRFGNPDPWSAEVI